MNYNEMTADAQVAAVVASWDADWQINITAAELQRQIDEYEFELYLYEISNY